MPRKRPRRSASRPSSPHCNGDITSASETAEELRHWKRKAASEARRSRQFGKSAFSTAVAKRIWSGIMKRLATSLKSVKKSALKYFSGETFTVSLKEDVVSAEPLYQALPMFLRKSVEKCPPNSSTDSATRFFVSIGSVGVSWMHDDLCNRANTYEARVWRRSAPVSLLGYNIDDGKTMEVDTGRVVVFKVCSVGVYCGNDCRSTVSLPYLASYIFVDRLHYRTRLSRCHVS